MHNVTDIAKNAILGISQETLYNCNNEYLSVIMKIYSYLAYIFELMYTVGSIVISHKEYNSIRSFTRHAKQMPYLPHK